MSTVQEKHGLPHSIVARSKSLLPMLYKVSELAEELDLPESTLRSRLIAGAPYERDKRGHFWINGKDFAEWVAGQTRTKQPRRLADDEAYCMRCKTNVHLLDAHIQPGKGKQQYTRGMCGVCGATLIRGGRVD